MKKSFICSLCHNGIVGGAIYIEDSAITYKTNKLTVDQQYKNLILPIDEISELSWKFIIFPIATFRMKNEKEYKFIIFNKSRFEKYYSKVKKSVS